LIDNDLTGNVRGAWNIDEPAKQQITRKGNREE
jgi:hypothetical protein